MMRGSLLATCLIFLTHVFGEVTVRIMTQYIYEKSPKLRIRGSGFDANDHDILLDLGSVGQPSLIVDTDFSITKDSEGDGLILKLLGNRRYVSDVVLFCFFLVWSFLIMDGFAIAQFTDG